MKHILLFASILLMTLFAESQESFTITSPVPSLLSPDNVSAGFMIRIKTGRIMHFFRLDPGPAGNHTGNNGRIAMRYTDDEGASWSRPSTVYDDEFDDRNVSGCLTEKGRIVLFFRRFDVKPESKKHVDYNMIFSDDNAKTWSKREVIKSDGEVSDAPVIPFIPGKGFMTEIVTFNYVETRFSVEGLDWSKKGYTWDYRKDKKFKINESCFAYTGNGLIIGLMRDNLDRTDGINYYQVSSSDYGSTWTEPVHTNIANGYYCAAPLIFYDKTHDELWAVATDRRFHNPAGYEKAHVWVFHAKPSDIAGKPDNWTLATSFPRPNPNPYMFYGYPCVIQKSNGDYLVVFTESSRPNGNEHSEFYQFEIKYSSK